MHALEDDEIFRASDVRHSHIVLGTMCALRVATSSMCHAVRTFPSRFLLVRRSEKTFIFAAPKRLDIALRVSRVGQNGEALRTTM